MVLPTAEAVECLLEQGYVVLHEAVDAGVIGRVREQLAPHLASAPFGRNEFEGLRSQRVYALLAKAPAIAGLVAHEQILAILDKILASPYQLSANLAINVHPGETAQMLHGDDSYCALPRPRRPQGVSAVWAISDFTRDNGATEVVPGSHNWGDEIPDLDEYRIVPIEMTAGSVVVFLGTTLHRGGANVSDEIRLGISPQYCQPWMRQIENMALAVPPPVAATLPMRVQELLGYSIYPPFIGYVDGRHPKRVLDAWMQ